MLLAEKAGALKLPDEKIVRSLPHLEAVSLSPRVSPNIPLGDDPTTLPLGYRAQAEPFIARNPVDPQTLVGIFQEGRYATNGGAVTCGYAVSHDGGRSWRRALIPFLTTLTGGEYKRATDPVVAFDHQGNCYLSTLAFDVATSHEAIVVNKSTDGGDNFNPPQIAVVRPLLTDFLDKDWIAVDAHPNSPHPGRIAVTFTNFRADYSAPIMSALSDDGGITWTQPILASPAGTSCQGSQPIFLPDGMLVIVYFSFNDNTMKIVRSADGGYHYDSPITIDYINTFLDSEARDGWFLPSASAALNTGTIFVTIKGKLLKQKRILFTRSTDAGLTWSQIIPIDDPPTPTDPDGIPAFIPSLIASPDARQVSVIFYDKRNDPERRFLVDVYLAESYNGGLTWEPNLRITDVSSDMRLAPLTSEGYMLGDYLGIAESRGGDAQAVPIWIDTRRTTPDPFACRVSDYQSGTKTYLLYE